MFGSRLSFRVSLVLLSLIVFAASAEAQTMYMQTIPEEKPKFGLRFFRPNLASDADLSLMVGTFDLYASVPVSRSANVYVSVPSSRIAGDDIGESEFALGNPFIGIQGRQGNPDSHLSSFMVGVHLPLADDEKPDAAILGWFSNWHEFYRVIPDVWTLYGGFTNYWTRPGPTAPMYSTQLGSILALPTANGADSEFFIQYGLSGGVRTQKMSFWVEWLGLFIVTEDVDGFGERFDHQLSLCAGLTGYTVRPALSYQIAVDDDLNNVIDGVLGLKIEVVLP